LKKAAAIDQTAGRDRLFGHHCHKPFDIFSGYGCIIFQALTGYPDMLLLLLSLSSSSLSRHTLLSEEALRKFHEPTTGSMARAMNCGRASALSRGFFNDAV
jgi:hypothetical protein